jgi:hypothetical protein
MKNNGQERRENRARRAWQFRRYELIREGWRSDDDKARIRREMDTIRNRYPRLKLAAAAEVEAKP